MHEMSRNRTENRQKSNKMSEQIEVSDSNGAHNHKCKPTKKLKKAPGKNENLCLIIKKNENGILTSQRKRRNKQKLIKIGDTTIKESIIRKCIINGLKEIPIVVVPCIIEKTDCVANE